MTLGVPVADAAKALFDERGAGWTQGMNATWPFFRLRVYEDRLVYSAFGRTHEIERHELVRLRRARRLFMTGIAIEHSCSGAPESMVFSPMSRPRLEAVLESAGYEIEGDYSWPGVA